MAFVSQALTKKNLSPYSSGRNIVYAVSRYFLEHRDEINQAIKSSEKSEDLDFKKLLFITIKSLTRSKNKKLKSGDIKSFITKYLAKPRKLTMSELSQAQKTRPEISQRLTKLAEAEDFGRFSRTNKVGNKQMSRELRLFEHEIADPQFTRSPHRTIQQESWNQLQARVREAASLDLYGFDRDSIADLMSESGDRLSNRVLTNYLLSFRTQTGSSKEQIENIKKDIARANIPLAHSYIQKTIEFLFDLDELSSDDHFTQDYSDQEIAYIAQQLLKRDPLQTSTPLIKEFIRGKTVEEIAKKTKTTSSTVRRNISSARERLRLNFKSYHENPAPDGLNPFAWVYLSDFQQKLISQFTQGKDMQQIAKSLKVKAQKVYTGFKDAIKKLGIKKETLADMFVSARVQGNSKAFIRKRLLQKIYGTKIPKTFDDRSQTSYKNELFEAAKDFLQGGNFTSDKRNHFKLYTQGLDSKQIASLEAIDEAEQLEKESGRVSSGITASAQRLKRHLRENIIAKGLNKNLSNLDQCEIVRNRFIQANTFPANTRYSLESLKLTARKDVDAVLSKVIKDLEDSNLLSAYFKAYIHKISLEELSEYFSDSEDEIGEALENDFEKIRELAKIILKVELPEWIEAENFARLNLSERTALLSTLKGAQFQDILNTNSSLFNNNLKNLMGAYQRACKKLSIESSKVLKHRNQSAIQNYSNFDFAKSSLLRTGFDKKPNAPEGVKESDFDYALQKFLWLTVKDTKTQYKKEWEKYAAGVNSISIAKQHGHIASKQTFLANMSSLKRNLRRKASRFLQEINSKTKFDTYLAQNPVYRSAA